MITSAAAYFELTFQQIVITKAAKHIKPQLNKQQQQQQKKKTWKRQGEPERERNFISK